MEINKRIEEARKVMKKYKVDAYIVTSSDYHQSEYIDDYFKGREYLSGFTGSAGVLVIFKDEACLWTDGRYHIQAEKQLKGSEVKLFKQGNLGVPTYKEYIISKLAENSKIGIDAKILLSSDINEILSKKKYKIVDFDLLEEVWDKRKKLPDGKIFILEDKYTGKTYKEKVKEIREILKEKGADYNIISSLDDIAWIYNFRGDDVQHNPVALSFTIISKKNSILYIDKNKLDDKTQKYFKDNKVEIKEYFEFFEDIKKLKGNILVDFNKISYAIYEAISKNTLINSMNPSTYLKAHKNETEITNTKEIHIQDGVAIVKFMYWLKNNYKKENITEFSAEEKINSLREKIEGYIDLSFSTISAFGKNAAMMHYSAPEKNSTKIEDGVYLLDSGGTYLKGTTDITRTFFLGKVGKEEKNDNTLVLKGMLALSRAKFLFGATGTNLDILARQFLWNVGIDYKCGTGHGVGHILNVHEGPHGIRFQYNPQRLEVGMIVTNEPGAYIEGSHGIRIENELLVKEACETEHGQFLEFETITYAPIDLDGIVKTLLTKEEKQQLNEYHSEVYKKLSPYLNKKEKEFLKEYTKSI
ncbi:MULTISPECIES: aminopeptidase P family protein [Fusobacterium]|uniref:Xaa-Pro aminopeptidase n=1 Tax=Fusobacterium nucleatum subsp. polymorphum TaxID=76857 RepID=A0A2C6C0T2_FUSNP|nr:MULTISPECIES: aminopeptidase P family protein [Fusobacterium]EUB28908.1 metallopeptidase family M24 [Fusobacterium sp. CM22]PHI12406.1 Xaa-Pro aminopeptidase [Fusobacterium polymorphum]